MELIYDANNFLRRKFETGGSVRLCYCEVRGQPGTIVFDGKNAKARRKAVYPAYKTNRQPMVTSLFTQFNLFKETMQWLNVPVVQVPGWEADDVIATLVRTSPNDDFFIKSNDVDFLQLPNVKIERDKPPPVNVEDIRLYKAVVGDPSDNIPGFKGFGKKAWDKLSPDDKEQLTKYLEGDTDYYPETLPVAVMNWLDERENKALVRTFWNIVDLYTVPMEEIVANTTVGVYDPDRFEQELKRFMI